MNSIDFGRINPRNCRILCGHHSAWKRIDLPVAPPSDPLRTWGDPPKSFGEMLDAMWNSRLYSLVCDQMRKDSQAAMPWTNRWFARSAGFLRISAFGLSLKYHDSEKTWVPFSSRFRGLRVVVNERFFFNLAKR
jgi:hypothetical protein